MIPKPIKNPNYKDPSKVRNSDGRFEYQEIVREEFFKRKAESHQYTLRQFAIDLKMDVSHLYKVIAGTKGLGRKTAQNVAEGMGLSDIEYKRFLWLVLANSARAKYKRNAARLYLKGRPPEKICTPLQILRTVI